LRRAWEALPESSQHEIGDGDGKADEQYNVDGGNKSEQCNERYYQLIDPVSPFYVLSD
jgi:hypothetical protein